MADTVAEQDGRALDTLTGPPERYGHGGVHGGLAEFCGAWSIGVDALCDRARSNGTSLREAAGAYRAAEAHAARALAGDPALDVVEPEVPLR